MASLPGSARADDPIDPAAAARAVLSSAASLAAPLDADTAKTVALQVLMLAPPAAAAGAGPNAAALKTSYDPNVTVEAQGAGQLVTVKNPTYTFGKDQDTVAFPSLAVLVGVAPDSNGQKRYTVAYQKPEAPTISESGKPVAKMSYGKFDASGVYAPNLSSFITFKGSLADVLANDPSSTDVIKIASITIDQNATEESGTLSGQNVGLMKGFELTSNDGTISIGEARETIGGAKIALSPWLDGFRQVAAIMPKSPTEKPDQAATNKQINASLDVVEKMPPLADSLSGQLSLSDLKVLMKDQTGVSISTMALGLAFQRPTAGTGDGQLDFTVAGVAVPKQVLDAGLPPDTPPALIDMIPSGGHVTVSVKGAPTKDIMAQLVKAARTYTNTTDQSTFDTGMQAVTQSLGNAHSQLALGLDLASRTVKLVGNSAFTVDSQSAYGLDGTAKLTLTGLDPQMEKLRGAAQPTAQQASVVMTMLKGMGTPRPAGNDIVYDYNIVVGQDGKLTVNGQDLAGMMGAGGPPAAPGPDTAPAAPAPSK